MTKMSPLSQTRLSEIIARFGKQAELQSNRHQPKIDKPWQHTEQMPANQTVSLLINTIAYQSADTGQPQNQNAQALILCDQPGPVKGDLVRVDEQIWHIRNSAEIGNSATRPVYQLALSTVAG